MQTSSEACQCRKLMFKMEATMEEGQKCHNCSQRNLGLGPNGNCVSHDSMRRYLAFRNAQFLRVTALQRDLLSEGAKKAVAEFRKVVVTLAKASELSRVHEAAVKSFASADYSGIEKTTWLTFNNCVVPLRTNEYLIDRSHFLSPKLRIVPPGTIADHSDRCGVCWGSFSSADPEEACSGEGARKLPCGHIYGHKCLIRLFQKSRRPFIACPHCRAEFRSTQARRYSERPFVDTILQAFEDNNGLLGGLASCALFPWFVAVVLTMDIAPKLNVDSADDFKGASRWYKALFILIAFSMWPLIFIAGWAERLGHGVNLLFAKMGFNLATKIGSLTLGIMLTMLAIAVVSWLTKTL
jgi:hypothetical protein